MTKPLWLVMNLELLEGEDGRVGSLPVFDDIYAARTYAKQHENADVMQIAGDQDEL